MPGARWEKWKRVDIKNNLVIYAIYENLPDYPGKFTVFRSKMKNARVTIQKKPMLAEDLEDARSCVPPGLMRLERFAVDEFCLVEVWL